MRLLAPVVVMLAGCAAGHSVLHPTAHQYAQATPTVDSATNGCLRNPSCYTQVGNEAPMAWALRSTQAVRTTTAALRLLEAAELARVEQILVECAQDAHFTVNEELLGEGRAPTREQCKQVVRQENGKDVTLAMELGRRKHEKALDCASAKLEPLFPKNISINPRYKRDPSGRWQWLYPELVAQWLRDRLFDLLLGTLVPDVVVHDSGNPLRGQRVYDFKFPCRPTTPPAWREYPEGHPHHPKAQGEMYEEALGLEGGKASLVTPQLGVY